MSLIFSWIFLFFLLVKKCYLDSKIILGLCQASYSLSYMTTNCAKTCQKCPQPVPIVAPATAAPTPNCSDMKGWCARWALVGLCSVPLMNEYMSTQCPQSCHTCH